MYRLAYLALLASLVVSAPPARGEGSGAPSDHPLSLVLITLDTTRADYIGAYGNASVATPHLDALAQRGTRYEKALSPSPLTLPAHASLLTGLLPPEHGVQDNGISALAPDLPTLATRLKEHGYQAAAFVGSQVLDHRFGLDRGFDVYDDRMAAERIGEYGYPERDAAAVTSAALSWLAEQDRAQPLFLWVHYYDPHYPYSPTASGSSSPKLRYAAEIARVDEQIGLLLSDFAGEKSRVLVVAVGDHGESLGEHGERSHGLFLYRSSLEVPLILAGPGIPAGKTISRMVSTSRLASTLLELLKIGSSSLPGSVLPGLLQAEVDDEVIYSDTRMPSTVYGWSSLRAVSDQRWRLIVAPRPELYDTEKDPGENQNLYSGKRDEARRLAGELRRLEEGFETRQAESPQDASELAATLRSLGYLAGSANTREGEIDPKDGLLWLEDFRRAKELLGQGRQVEALRVLELLNEKSPGNVPFLVNLARAQEVNGRLVESLETIEQALELNPNLDFLHISQADVLRRMGRKEDARKAFEEAIALNERAANAWLGLAEIAYSSGQKEKEVEILRRAVSSGTASISILSRIADIELERGRFEAADKHLARSIELVPTLAQTWITWGDAALAQSHWKLAIARYEQASELDPRNPKPHLRLGDYYAEHNQVDLARDHLETALRLAGADPIAVEAQKLLATLEGR